MIVSLRVLLIVGLVYWILNGNLGRLRFCIDLYVFAADT